MATKKVPSSFEIAKSDKVKIVASLTDWPPDKNPQERILDIRTWVLDKTGQNWIATAKGVQIPIKDAKKFAIRLTKIVRAELGE